MGERERGGWKLRKTAVRGNSMDYLLTFANITKEIPNILNQQIRLAEKECFDAQKWTKTNLFLDLRDLLS